MFRHISVQTDARDTPVVRVREREAESSNLSIPTTSASFVNLSRSRERFSPPRMLKSGRSEESDWPLPTMKAPSSNCSLRRILFEWRASPVSLPYLSCAFLPSGAACRAMSSTGTVDPQLADWMRDGSHSIRGPRATSTGTHVGVRARGVRRCVRGSREGADGG